jgi:hypothetical protein
MSLLQNAFGVLYEREAGGRPAPGFFARLDAGVRIPFHGWVERRMAYWDGLRMKSGAENGIVDVGCRWKKSGGRSRLRASKAGAAPN